MKWVAQMPQPPTAASRPIQINASRPMTPGRDEKADRDRAGQQTDRAGEHDQPQIMLSDEAIQDLKHDETPYRVRNDDANAYMLSNRRGIVVRAMVNKCSELAVPFRLRKRRGIAR